MTTKLPPAREAGEEEGRELTGLVMSLGVQGGGGEGGGHVSCRVASLQEHHTGTLAAKTTAS